MGRGHTAIPLYRHTVIPLSPLTLMRPCALCTPYRYTFPRSCRPLHAMRYTTKRPSTHTAALRPSLYSTSAPATARALASAQDGKARTRAADQRHKGRAPALRPRSHGSHGMRRRQVRAMRSSGEARPLGIGYVLRAVDQNISLDLTNKWLDTVRTSSPARSKPNAAHGPAKPV